MSRVRATSERIIAARPAEVYAALTDYQGVRPHILTANFLNYTVEQGGQGSGTVISYHLQAARRERPYRLRVSESIKGQVLTESDMLSSLVTTWTLTPMRGGQYTKVEVETAWTGGTGIGGFFERTFAPLGLRRIYANILSSLAQVVESVSSTGAARAKKSSNVGPVLLLVGVAAVLIAGAFLAQRLRDQRAANIANK